MFSNTCNSVTLLTDDKSQREKGESDLSLHFLIGHISTTDNYRIRKGKTSYYDFNNTKLRRGLEYFMSLFSSESQPCEFVKDGKIILEVDVTAA